MACCCSSIDSRESRRSLSMRMKMACLKALKASECEMQYSAPLRAQMRNVVCSKSIVYNMESKMRLLCKSSRSSKIASQLERVVLVGMSVDVSIAFGVATSDELRPGQTLHFDLFSQLLLEVAGSTTQAHINTSFRACTCPDALAERVGGD